MVLWMCLSLSIWPVLVRIHRNQSDLSFLVAYFLYRLTGHTSSNPKSMLKLYRFWSVVSRVCSHIMYFFIVMEDKQIILLDRLLIVYTLAVVKSTDRGTIMGKQYLKSYVFVSKYPPFV